MAYLPTFEREGFEFAREVTSPGYAIIEPETGSRTEIPYYDWAPEVHEFHNALYSAGIIMPFFDWGSWHEEAKRFIDDPRALEEADELTLRRLLTTHSRAERFSEGHFVEIVQVGAYHGGPATAEEAGRRERVRYLETSHRRFI